MFVVDRNRQLQGIITVDMAVEAANSGISSLNEVELAEGPVVKENTPVLDTLGIIAESKLPMAVVNEENKLTGIIVRGAVLAALASHKGGAEND